VRGIYPTVPYKPFVFLGLLICACSGAITPIFLFRISRLMFEVSIGATDTAAINALGGIILAVPALDGLLMGLKYFIMETSGMAW
jgi:ATP-binding cassette subfamily B (MDR/TAP) protein 1